MKGAAARGQEWKWQTARASVTCFMTGWALRSPFLTWTPFRGDRLPVTQSVGAVFPDVEDAGSRIQGGPTRVVVGRVGCDFPFTWGGTP